MAADKHYLTDVLTGAVFGAALGFGLPALFHRPVKAGPVEARITAGAGGLAVVGQW